MGGIMGEDEDYWNECFNDYALMSIFENKTRLNKLSFFQIQRRGGNKSLRGLALRSMLTLADKY